MTTPASSAAETSPMEYIRLANARHNLVTAAGTYTRALSPEDSTPLDVATGRLAVAARNLVELTDRAPARLQPEGWPR